MPQELNSENAQTLSGHFASTEGLGVIPAVRARTLLALLWRKYDLGGISVGRSHESVLLEAAMSLLGDPDVDDLQRADTSEGYGDMVDETRTWISRQTARRYGFRDA